MSLSEIKRRYAIAARLFEAWLDQGILDAAVIESLSDRALKFIESSGLKEHDLLFWLLAKTVTNEE